MRELNFLSSCRKSSIQSVFTSPKTTCKMSNSSQNINPTFRPLQSAKLYLPNKRPTIGRIPSPKCQTILFKSAMEHLCGVEHFASFSVISETFRNSSFPANFLMNLAVDGQTLPLFSIILLPDKCMSIQFIHSLQVKFDAYDDQNMVSAFLSPLVKMKYLRLQLQSLSFDHVDSPLISLYFETPWPRLKNVSLIACPISDADVELVVGACPCLTSLDLKWCDRVTNDSLKVIAEKLPELVSLGLYGISNITDTGLGYICSSSLTALTSLDLTWLYEISDNGLKNIGNNLPSLTFLSISRCVDITDVGFEHIIEGLPALTHLAVSDCRNISYDARQQFKDTHPSCKLEC